MDNQVTEKKGISCFYLHKKNILRQTEYLSSTNFEKRGNP